MILSSLNSPGPTVVAIPARDERQHIAACLRAIDAQTQVQADHIVLCVNNSTDGTADVSRNVALRPGTALHVIEVCLPPFLATVGHARRVAMDMAATLSGPLGAILTTDADGVVDRQWIAANLAALRHGADAVAGWVELDQQDWLKIPTKLHEDDARECAYDALCDEIHARLDPDPADPWPRHTQQSGASIAVSAAMYHLAGGMPAIAAGEDRAFLAALRRVDARVRHAPECRVVVSGRTQGRAPGGMADTIRRRMVASDAFLDDRLEPAEDCARRARLRFLLRACFADPTLVEGFARDAGLDYGCVATLVQHGRFGVAWNAIEASSLLLQRRRVAVADLPEEMARAELICASLRCVDDRPLSNADMVAAA